MIKVGQIRVANSQFIDPMQLLRKEKLPEGADWLYEIKLDGSCLSA